MNQQDIKQILLSQIHSYLNGEITKEEFFNIAEPFYTENAMHIESTEFYQIFSNTIPDACLYYIEEPDDTENSEQCFKRILEEVYEKLQIL